jgi:hypothetical protein
LGLQFVRSWGDASKQAAMFDTGAGIVEIFSGGPAQAEEGFIVHLALTSSDVDADYNRALAAGATSQKIPADYDIKASEGSGMKVRIAFVISPTGEVIELIRSL